MTILSRLSLLAISTLLAVGLCVGQADGSSGPLTSNHYENALYRFKVAIPEGWQLASTDTFTRVQKSITDRSKVSLLLVLEPAAGGPLSGTVVAVEGEKFNGERMNAEVGRLYEEQVVRNDVAVTLKPVKIPLGGIDFYRTDLKGQTSGQDHYFSLLATGVSEGVLTFNIHGEAEDAIDKAVSMLIGAVEFVPDWSLPDSQLDKCKLRIRVSMGVSQGLLRKQAAPKYPERAFQRHIQGYVVLSALLTRKGDIERLWILEGDPTFAEAAIDAVRQWKYKPYLLNGEPVKVETKIMIKFTLR